jgi:ech hydrogenase subunit D
MDREAFLGRIGEYRRAGWRLALVNATSVAPAEGAAEGSYDLSWTFEKGGQIEHVRERVARDEEVPSISGLFGPAFLYENEIRDLFGVRITGIAVDFKGELYRTAIKLPFSPRAIQERLDAAKVKR